MNDEISLISPELIKENSAFTAEIEWLCDALWREIGWHYLVDLIWIFKKLNEHKLGSGATIVDAGAGSGILQYLLAFHGYEVVSVDFSRRRFPILPYFALPISWMPIDAPQYNNHYIKHLNKVDRISNKIKRLPRKLIHNRFSLLKYLSLIWKRGMFSRKLGNVIMYRTDMTNMERLRTSSVNAVVSVSAIEHMDHGNIPNAIREFKRILNPGAPIIITTSAAKSKDWFHENSKGWCFSEPSLRSMFKLDSEVGSNFREYDELMADYQESDELKNRLSSLYFVSGDNGMPWGVWDPKYIPVGIVKHIQK